MVPFFFFSSASHLAHRCIEFPIVPEKEVVPVLDPLIRITLSAMASASCS
ncbi:MAG: hypothetical protein ABIN36_09710 [Ferruginibacter sp.]